ncbi:C-type lectin domain family 4 member K isoform 2-T2 [Morphnus guianensis]
MAAAGPDLYESLQIRYPPSPARAPALGSPLAASRWTLGAILAMGMGVVLVLGAALAVLITLHVKGQAELWAAQAELAAVRAPLLPDPDGPRSPSESPAVAQRRKEQFGNVPGLGGGIMSGMSGMTPIPGPPWSRQLAPRPHGCPLRRAVAAGTVPGLAVPPREDLLLLGGAEAVGRRGGRLPLHALPPHLRHQPRGAGLPGAGDEGKILLDRTGGHGPGGLLALGGWGCLFPGPESHHPAVLRG